MFGTQAIRLMRESWKGAQELAEELFAMFQGDIPLEHNAPITITSNTDEAPLTLRAFGDLGTVITISRIGDSGTIVFDGDGNLQFGDPAGNPIQPPAPPPQQGGGGFYGRVLGGSGDTYQVLLSNGSAVTATQLQIEASETIPVDTYAIVVQVGNAYFMQVPVWL